MGRAMWISATLGLLAMLMLAGGGRAVAQQLEPPGPRQGYYLSLGVYGAATAAHEKGAWVGPWVGGGGAVRVGELITRRFGLGLTIEGSATRGDGQKASVLALGAEASFAVVGNLALRGGLGIASMGLHDPRDPFESSTRGVTGARFAAGVSYDWFVKKKRLSGGYAITPSVQLRYVPGGDTYGFYTLIGVELTYWTGLPPRQLALPASEAWRK
ncbi:MAG TPA: hypothetical protein VNO55_32000 [Polyangia bacterium]|nr:hypothetical protein [Polyangia bacterium]